MALIAARVTRVRRARGLAIEELAQRSKITESELDAILRGRRNLQIQTLFRLAAALEVRPTALLDGIEWMMDEGGGGHFEIEGSRDD
ncbi:MAG: helix-turn-helix transcriptional regulator [Actinobacteria bacterium]|nr:helix-turn-helix transcriptional regulator [Actinomycetota bacterium]